MERARPDWSLGHSKGCHQEERTTSTRDSSKVGVSEVLTVAGRRLPAPTDVVLGKVLDRAPVRKRSDGPSGVSSRTISLRTGASGSVPVYAHGLSSPPTTRRVVPVVTVPATELDLGLGPLVSYFDLLNCSRK